MDRQEKYYNYIVSDLVSKTRIETDVIWFPFHSDVGYWPRVLHTMNKENDRDLIYYFDEYVVGRYGAKEEEVILLYDKYVDAMLDT